MFEAQTITAHDDTATELYSPWMPRGGDYGLFTLEIAALGAAGTSVTLEVEMVHKDSDTPGDGTDIDSLSISRTATGRETVDFGAGEGSPGFGGFEELVRYKFTLTPSASTSGTSWATFRMLSPVWYDAV